MTAQEFSNEFDILYNNIMSNQAPGLDEYEKSVFLTKAQDEIIKNYYNSKSNKLLEGIDASLKRQIDFSTLQSYASAILSNIPSDNFLSTISGAFYCSIPTDIFIILNEVVNYTVGLTSKTLQVLSLKYNEYTRLNLRPYKYPLKNLAWRLDMEVSNITPVRGNRNICLVLQPNITSKNSPRYLIRYLRKPHPILLEDFSTTDLSINGENTPTKFEECCELDSLLHPEILQRAVELAKAAYIGDINAQLQMGQRSE